MVYYKESHIERTSPEVQRHYLLKCLNAELGEHMLAITEHNNLQRMSTNYAIWPWKLTYPMPLPKTSLSSLGSLAARMTSYEETSKSSRLLNFRIPSSWERPSKEKPSPRRDSQKR